MPFQAAPQMNLVSPKPVDRSLIQGDDLLLRPRSYRQEEIEVLQSPTLKSQVPNARLLQMQQPAMPQEPASMLPVFAQIKESEPALSFDCKRPYKQPTKYQISKAVDVSDDDTEALHDRRSKPSDPCGLPAQTRLRFDKPANMDTISENIKDQGPTFKYLVPNGRRVSKHAVTGAAEKLDTLPQFLRDLSVRHETPEIEEVMSYVTSTV